MAAARSRPTLRGERWLPLIIAAAGIAAYANSFSGIFVFDDQNSIVNNATIHHWRTACWPPASATVSGRPVLNLSLALNYALSKDAVWSYHALNLTIHLFAGLLLFGIVRHTFASRTDQPAGLVAFVVALLWVLHPLQTESVTYIIQRAESLMGLFYLLTLYCFIRGAQAAGPCQITWYAGSLVACLLGMGTKEVMASAPLIVLLYDRTFVAGSFGEAFRSRWKLYAGLAATWLLLGALVFSTHGRNGSAGFATGISWWTYALTQCSAIIHYLRLCFWPHPLIFDYGTALTTAGFGLVACAVMLATLLAVTLWALVKRPGIGFLGVSFFAILAPSSSFVPVATETMAEHRMYLPLISVAVLVVIGIKSLLGRSAMPVFLALTATLGWLTVSRNQLYHSEEALWADTVAARPDNARAQSNLAVFLYRRGQTQEAITHYEQALRLKPDYAEAQNNLGNALVKVSGRTEEAIGHYQAALQIDPNYVAAHYNLASAFNAIGRVPEAIAHYNEALQIDPNYAEAHYNLGSVLGNLPGRLNDAIAHYEAAVRLRPDYLEAHNNLGNALSAVGRLSEAIAQFEIALRLKPDAAPIHFNLAIALLKNGRTKEAIGPLKEAIRLQPNNDLARDILARITLPEADR